jgi:FHS family glucose/mannose:H+ symporter-like MFS transporter
VGDTTRVNPNADPSLRQRFSLYPSQFICAVVMVSLGPLLDSMMRDLNIPLRQGGLISAGLFLGEVVGIIILNTHMAKVPAKWALVAGGAHQGAGLIAVGAGSWNLWSLFAAYLFVGLGWALLNTIGWMWVPAHIRKGTAAAALLMILFFALGMMLTPLVLGLAIDLGATWRWIIVAEGGVSLLLALVFAALPLLDIPGRENVRFSHLKRVIAFDRWLLVGMVGASFMYVGTETSLNVWLPKFQLDTFGAGDTWASLSVTLFWVGLVAGRLAVRPLTRRFSPSRILLLCACTLAVFTVALALAPTQATSLVLSVGAGLGASASFGIIGSYSGRFPDWQSGVASSVFVLAGGVGSMVFPYLTGPIASAAGFRLALAVTAIPAVAYGLLTLLIHARSGEGRPSANDMVG